MPHATRIKTQPGLMLRSASKLRGSGAEKVDI